MRIGSKLGQIVIFQIPPAQEISAFESGLANVLADLRPVGEDEFQTPVDKLPVADETAVIGFPQRFEPRFAKAAIRPGVEIGQKGPGKGWSGFLSSAASTIDFARASVSPSSACSCIARATSLSGEMVLRWWSETWGEASAWACPDVSTLTAL